MRSRKRYTKSERARWVAQFENSGISAAAFSRKHGLGPQSLLRWRKAVEAAPRKHPSSTPESKNEEIKFVELDLSAPAGKVVGESHGGNIAAELELPHGIRLRIFEPSATNKQ